MPYKVNRDFATHTMRSFSFAVVLAALSSATATIVFWDKPGVRFSSVTLSLAYF